jgi:hypothetical protein
MKSNTWRINGIRLLAVVLGLFGLPRICRADDDLARQAETLKTHYAEELGRLAEWCRHHELTTEAKATLDLAAPQEPYKIVLPALPPNVGSLRAPESATGERAEWQRRLSVLRQEQAAGLFRLARRGAALHQTSLAYRLALETLRADPDHEAARNVFGFQKYQDQWRTPFEVRMLQNGMVWHEKFGWIEKADLPHYTSGERPMGRVWIDAANDTVLHTDIAHGWDVETEHYRIRTNHSVEAAVALGAKLECLNRVWRQVFISYWSSPAEIEARFSDRPPPEANLRRLQIVYYRDKKQYYGALERRFPDVGISLGVYVPEDRAAYFFAGGEESERTTYHEATHQLFMESRPSSIDVRRSKANFWLVEGIAMYMETLRREGNVISLGGLNDARIVAARRHLEKNDYYVPFGKLVRMGMKDVQTDPQIAKLYSQMAGMASFLMHYDDGRYREALAACLRAVYDGSEDPDLLARTTGVTYLRLDEQYKTYMRENPKSEARNTKQIENTKH